jgi:CheY-like chemotaxis protein
MKKGTDGIKFSGNVLVAEDNPSNQMLIMLLLGKLGFETTIAKDGQIAVDLFESKPFRAVMMDMMMPNMNGYEATRTLRKRGVEVPIIAVTANAMTGDKEKCLVAGCDDYISKPITMEKLKQTLLTFLEPEASSDSEQTAISSELANDPDLCIVAEMFVERLNQLTDSIKQAMQDGDVKKLKDLFHEIKGAGGSAGFPILTEKSAYIEKLIIDNKPDELKKSLDEFYNICSRVEAPQKIS